MLPSSKEFLGLLVILLCFAIAALLENLEHNRKVQSSTQHEQELKSEQTTKH